MDNTTSDFHKVLKPETSSLELNTTNMDLLNNFSEINQPLSSQIHGLLDYFSNNNIGNNSNTSDHQPYVNDELPFSSVVATDSHQILSYSFDQKSLPSDLGFKNHDKSAIPTSEISEMVPSKGFVIEKDHGIGGRKRKRKNGGKEENPREVIHVRAKRGQATDSHSLAERVRRERINEKLRALQDIVPGCYKTMGMAVMLDVIINYVQSLQNQIEFLSMKLSAASLYYNFNSPEAEALETLHKTTNPRDVHESGKILREEHGEIPSWVQSTWPPGL